MITKDEQLAVLQQLTYKDSRKVKEARRGKDFVISKALFLQSFYGKNNKIKRQLIEDFFSKVKSMTDQNKLMAMVQMGKNGNRMSDVKIAPISPRLIK